MEFFPTSNERYAKPRNRNWLETLRVLTKFTSINHRPIALIKRLDMERVLDGLLVKTPYRANRALAAISKLFSWCVNRGILEFFPLARLEAPTNQSTRYRVLTDGELNAYPRGI